MTPQLTPRQRQVLWLAANGYTAYQTAEVLGISAHAVRSKRKDAVRRLEAYNLTHAVAMAIRSGQIIP